MVDMASAAAAARRFVGRSLAVVGVGDGTGLATALRVGLEGARVTIAARSSAHLDHAAEVLGRAEVPFERVQVDVGTEGGAGEVVAAAVRRFGGLDALISTAGGYEPGSLAATDLAALERMLHVNLRTAFCATRAAAPELARSGRGAVVITGAVFGAVVPGPGILAYNTSKAASLGLVKSLAAELAPENVRVNAVLPGGITHKFDPDQDPMAGRRLLTGPALPQDVAAACAFLVSDEACWISGAALAVDGGFSVSRKPF